eukprot:COSAG02_NODE_20866_length_813_cov_0.710084_1_plen_36_part_10
MICARRAVALDALYGDPIQLPTACGDLFLVEASVAG